MYRILRAELMRKGWNQNQFADAMRMSAPQISMRMRGKIPWTLAEAVEVKKLLEVKIPLEELFRWSNV